MDFIWSVWAVEHPLLCVVAALIVAAIAAATVYVERKRAGR